MDVRMPQLGETVTEGTITRWLKAVGDAVRTDEPLFEVSTDKVDSEVPAPASGFVTELRAPQGDTVPVGAVVAVIDDAGSPAPEAAPAEPEPEPAVHASASAAERVAREPATDSASGGNPRFTSPVVRRLVTEYELDAETITGSGIGGRVTRKDVLDAVTQRGGAAAPPRSPDPPAGPAAAPMAATVAHDAGAEDRLPIEPAADTIVPMTMMRKRIAEHMVRSQRTSAHAYTSVEVDFERITRIRAAHRDSWRARESFSLTYLPFIARAVSGCIHEYPVVNASIDGAHLVLHPALHLCVAVDLAFEGLIAPVLRDVDGKRLRQIARELNHVATRSRTKQLSPDDVQGGTFTITNPGPYRTHQTLAIINQPQVAILATDGIRKQVTVIEGPDGGDVIAVRHKGLLTLGWDHRAFDGAYAAAFLGAVRVLLEGRDWEAELE